MVYIQEQYHAMYECKQSKFIAYLIPYADFHDTLQKLQLEHPKARHFVSAYRYFNEYDQIVEHSSDDGEPKGTSGKPSLFVLQGAEVINTAVIIVRYFGGTKLGTGGLVRAYSDSVNLVLESATLHEFQKKVSKKIAFEYTYIRLVEYEAQICGVDIKEKNFETLATFKVEASENEMNFFLKRIERTLFNK
jgi:uncharacterized YigZ family protein